jgi:hypothetical protein
MAAGDGPGPIGAYPHSGFWKRPNWNDEQVISEDYYEWFTEGCDAAALQEAKALLD